MMREQDRTAHVAAIRRKISAISKMQSTVFQMDPLAGFVKAGGLTIQRVETGEGKDFFGDSQEIARRESHRLGDKVLALASLISSPEAASKIRQDLAAWATQNPLPDSNFDGYGCRWIRFL
jgi:hypothetical protein